MSLHETEGRREHRRLETRFEVRFCSLDDEGRRSVLGTARDMSLSGIRFSTDRYLGVGDEVQMQFRGDAFPATFQTVGRIQRVERIAGRFEVGVKFISTAEKRTLEIILEDYLRRELAD